MTEFTGNALSALQAHEAIDLLRKREVSPKELLEISFARIEAVSPAINATVATCPERAFDAAIAMEASDQRGSLEGLPIGIKDLSPVSGVRTTYGNVGLSDHVPEESDPLVDRLEGRGGIVTGKTNTPEFGAGGNTFNPVYGHTRNPWDTRLNPGGSSGGAAASLAAGETWLSHGSDHGGSLRTPAAYCGIVGLRPSPGRAGGAGAEAAFMIEGAQGPMARSVMDCALFLDAMAGFDARYPISFPAPDTSFQNAVARAEATFRIAYAPDLGGFGAVDLEMREHLDGVMSQVERSGIKVEQACPDLSGLDQTYRTLRGMMWATMAPNIPPAVRASFKPELEANMAWGEGLTMSEIGAAQRGRSTIYANMLALFEHFDVLACPVTGCMPHPVEEHWVRDVGDETFGDYMDWLRFAFLATTTGLPAISVPVGIGPRGLPVGLQLIGKPRGEAELLAAARCVEQIMGGPLGPIDPNVTHL